jgi:hypothetical protein
VGRFGGGVLGLVWLNGLKVTSICDDVGMLLELIELIHCMYWGGEDKGNLPRCKRGSGLAFYPIP